MITCYNQNYMWHGSGVDSGQSSQTPCTHQSSSELYHTIPYYTIHALEGHPSGPSALCHAAYYPQAAHAQLASKEAKISQQIMAKMAQHLLSLHPEATNQGWIMEGWPKSLQAARLFCSGPAGGDTGKASGDRGARRVTGNVGKVRNKKVS